MEERKRKFKTHLAYWVLFTAFFSFVWGTYDQQYLRNLYVQLFSLPSRLTLVYTTLLFLMPAFLAKEKYRQFLIGFLLLLIICSVLIQRPIILFIVEGNFLPYNSPHFFKLNELVNTAIDVGIAAIVPLSYEFLLLWHKSKQALTRLTTNANLSNTRFLVLKEGNTHHKVFISDIVYIESMRNYLKVSTTEKDLISYGSITSILSELPDQQFLQIHRSFVVNLQFVASFTANHVMIKGIKINIGRTFKQETLKRLTDRTSYVT